MLFESGKHRSSFFYLIRFIQEISKSAPEKVRLVAVSKMKSVLHGTVILMSNIEPFISHKFL